MDQNKFLINFLGHNRLVRELASAPVNNWWFAGEQLCCIYLKSIPNQCKSNFGNKNLTVMSMSLTDISRYMNFHVLKYPFNTNKRRFDHGNSFQGGPN